jgi:hypothetical protein
LEDNRRKSEPEGPAKAGPSESARTTWT